MASDANTFSMGPSRIDPDRDMEYFATQATTQAVTTESVRELVTGAAQLLLGTSDGIAGVSDTVKVRLDDGSYISAALNATGQTVENAVSVVVAKVDDTTYVVVGQVSVSGGGGGTATFKTAYSANLFPSYAYHMLNDPVGLGLGDDVTLSGTARLEGATWVPYLLVINNVTLVSTLIPVSTGRPRWVGVHNNQIIATVGAAIPDVLVSSVGFLNISRYTVSTGTWTNLTSANEAWEGPFGPPAVVNGYLCMQDIFTTAHFVKIVKPDGTTLGLFALGSQQIQGIAGGGSTLWAVSYNSSLGTGRLLSRFISTTGSLGILTDRGSFPLTYVPPVGAAHFREPDTGTYLAVGDIMSADSTGNLFMYGKYGTGESLITRVTPTGARSEFVGILESFGAGDFVCLNLHVTSLATNIVFLSGYRQELSGDTTPAVYRINLNNSSISLMGMVNWPLYTSPAARVTGITTSPSGTSAFFVGSEDSGYPREIRYGVLP